MNFISKRTLILIFLAWVLTQGSFALASELKIKDFQMYKNTKKGDISLFYKHIFKESYIFPYTFFPLLKYPQSFCGYFELDPTASLSEKIYQKNIEDSANQDSLKAIRSSIRLFFKNTMRAYVLAQTEAAPLSEIILVSVT